MIEILSIGNEVLSGLVVNTNSAFIAQMLQKHGLCVGRHTVLSDDPVQLKKGIEEALARSSWVVTTGGLGPTFDDTTREVLSDVFASPLVLHEEILLDLEKRLGPLPHLSNQALFPKDAIMLPNPLGTAPGMILSSARGRLIAMPGIPQEMERMLEKEVIPYLCKHAAVETRSFTEDLYFALISETELNPILQEMKRKTKELTIGIYPSLGKIRAHFTVKGLEEKRAKALLFSLREKLMSLFPQNIYSSHSGSLAEVVQDLFVSQNKKLAIAESCTGGLLSLLITQIPDSSQYFLGSIVCYSNEMKRDVLKVTSKTLKEKGAVSREAVLEMIDGVFHTTKADYALAISGIAGPSGGTEDLPVGSVCIGIGKRGEKSDVGLILAPKDRLMVMEFSAHFALALLWRRAAFNLLYFSPL